MINERFARINALLDKRQPDLTVFMDEVHKPHNLAAIVRTADAVGVGRVHAVYPKDRVAACHGTASGSNRWVDVRTHSDLDTGIAQVKASGMQVLAAHFSERAVDFRSIDFTRPSCVLVGSELFGVSERAAELADEHVIIPMLGMVQSLNVSVATALILYEAQRQREAAGLYDARRISDASSQRLMVEWLHPQVSAYCQKHDLRYPHLNEQGDIDDPEWQALRQAAAHQAATNR